MIHKFDAPTKVFTLFLLIGVSLAMLNFVNNRSLWLDEAFLSLNIISKSPAALLEPLDLRQVAPIGFLFAEKTTASIGGNTDWSLRIFPLLSFLLCIPAVYSLALQLIKHKNFALFSAAFFSLSYHPIFFSSEVKQYMSDTLVCLIITLATVLFLKNKKNYSRLLFIGTLSIWFSNIAVILLFGAGLVLFHNAIKTKERREIMRSCLVVGSWVVSFGIYYFLFINNHPTRPYMLAFWNNAGAFLPYNVFDAAFYTAMMKKLHIYFRLLGAGIYSLATIPFLIIGLYFLHKKDWRFPFLLFLPFIIHLLLSYFKLYPFGLRLTLYLQPLLLLSIACGAYHSSRLIKQQYLQLLALSSILVACLLLLFHKGFPIEREEIKQALAYLESEIRDTDQLYVYHSAAYASSFYQRRYAIYSRLSEDNIIIGKSYRKDWAEYENDVDKITQPAWLLFSHVFRPKEPKGSLSEEEFILQILKKKGFQIIDKQAFKGSSVYKVIPGLVGQTPPYFSSTSCILLPQVSSKTAAITVPISFGGILNTTPSSVNRANSFWRSSTYNWVQGIPAFFSSS